VHNWERQLISSDIAVENKSLDEPSLQRRPSTKVLSYMAAAVPVVCTPSTADRSVIDHGRTGYLAYTPDDWYMYLKMLINDRGLRKQVGMAAREYALSNFTVNKITDKYTSFFDEVAAARR
jgi:glycosyltransferase involved in cell wall biosynthesis